jgi:hypothetical protein
MTGGGKVSFPNKYKGIAFGEIFFSKKRSGKSEVF